MTQGLKQATSSSLEPKDWEAFRKLWLRAVDETIDWLKTLDASPAWQRMPSAVRSELNEPLPRAGQSPQRAYEDFARLVRPFGNGNSHPRFWGWVQGSGLPLGAMADMLAAAMNPHLAGFDHAPRLVEEQVLQWLSSLMDFPKNTSGLLTSGASMANLIALTVARNAKADWDIRRLGVRGGSRPLIAYCCSESHSCMQRAIEMLGLGSDALRLIPTDAAFRMDVSELDKAIERDRSAGLLPFCVIANCGTVNTGAIDDLEAVSEIARHNDLWFHVDGAFGALAAISPLLKSRVAGLESADSVAFDLHKWMYLPFEVGCVLVKNAEAQREAFAVSPAYLGSETRGVLVGGLPFADRGVELTRGFKALKVWMCIKAYGIDAFAESIEKNVGQAEYVGRLVANHGELELLAPISLNVVCFRYAPANGAADKLDAVNREIILRLQESGTAVVSSTNIGGKLAIRCAIVNHRSQQSDFDRFISAVLDEGKKILAETTGDGRFA